MPNLRSIIKRGDFMDVQCDCGKLLAKVKDGKIYVWCKNCKKEVPLKIEYPQEPLSRNV